MKQRRNFWSADTLIVVLAALCLALAVLVAVARPEWLWAPLAVLVLAAGLILLFLQRMRRFIRRMLGGGEGQAGAGALTGFCVPAAALSGNRIVWYNEAFRLALAGGADCVGLPVARLAPGFALEAAAAPGGQDLALAGRRFTVYGNPLQADKNVFFAIFVEDTLLKQQADEFLASRPSVLYFVIDTYDEVLREMRESERAAIMSGIDLALERYIAKSSGFLRRVSTSRYLAVVEERHAAEMLARRFDILDEVRSTDEDNASVTLSIGMGRLGNSFRECEESAQQALDMALGRGGDQAAVKSPEGFEFYGGVTRSVEKRTKVKSRIVATAIRELVQQYDKVLVMGHKNADMDSLGAAVGMLRFCRICKKAAAIVVDEESSMSAVMLDYLHKNGYGGDLLGRDEALSLTGPRTLLVVVDTHMKYLLESAEVYNSCPGVVVIDHHRRMVGHIDNAIIFYHEPYASSASELVAELLQYVGEDKDDKPSPVEAECLLAGIMLDTRTFSLHVGVRTFEAAAWLRRMGAQTASVKKLFASSMNDYLYKSHLVSEAVIENGFAVVFSDKVPFECEVVAPQAANELLTIEGVIASFVGIEEDGRVHISARSMGEVNVQLVMEKIGGGGHLTMAGAQLSVAGLAEAEKRLYAAIREYMTERAFK